MATGFHQGSGDAIDGCYFGNTAVAFFRVVKSNIAQTTFTVPSSVTSFYVFGLHAGSTVTVTKTAVAGGTQVTLTAGGPVSVGSVGMVKF